MSTGLSVENVFNLVHRFGNEEDQISACFGFALSVNRKTALREFLHHLGIDLTTKEAKAVDIRTQVPYVHKGVVSRIDLQLRLDNRFLIFIEAKLRSGLGTNQITKYTSILKSEHPFYDHVRLVYVTQFDRRKEFDTQVLKQSALKATETFYCRWEDIRALVHNAPVASDVKRINRMFIDFVGDTMSDKRTMAEQRIKDIRDVLIIATDKDWWEFAEKEHCACNRNNTPDAQYIAFYQTHPISAITHIAKVVYTEKNVPCSETYREWPKIRTKGEERGWIKDVHKVYHLGKLVELPHPIKRASAGKLTIMAKCFTTMDNLLSAQTLDDLLKAKG